MQVIGRRGRRCSVDLSNSELEYSASPGCIVPELTYKSKLSLVSNTALNASFSQLMLEDRRQSLLDHCGSKLTQSKCFSMAERINYVHKVHLCNKEVTIGGGSIAEDDEARESLSSQVVPKQSAPFHSTASTNDLRSLSPINNISDDSVFTDGDLSENNGDDLVPTRLTRSSTAICNEPFRFVETEDDDNEADRTLDCIDRLRERNLARDDEFDDGHMPFLGYTNTPLS